MVTIKSSRAKMLVMFSRVSMKRTEKTRYGWRYVLGVKDSYTLQRDIAYTRRLLVMQAVK